jgi:hypothetical protein
MGVIKDLTGSFSGGLQLLSGFGMIAKRGTGTIVVLVTEERFPMVRVNNLSGSGGRIKPMSLGIPIRNSLALMNKDASSNQSRAGSSARLDSSRACECLMSVAAPEMSHFWPRT